MFFTNWIESNRDNSIKYNCFCRFLGPSFTYKFLGPISPNKSTKKIQNFSEIIGKIKLKHKNNEINRTERISVIISHAKFYWKNIVSANREWMFVYTILYFHSISLKCFVLLHARINWSENYHWLLLFNNTEADNKNIHANKLNKWSILVTIYHSRPKTQSKLNQCAINWWLKASKSITKIVQSFQNFSKFCCETFDFYFCEFDANLINLKPENNRGFKSFGLIKYFSRWLKAFKSTVVRRLI